MSWLILWFLLSVPVALLVAAFIAAGDRSETDSIWDSDLGPEMHDQTLVG